MKLETRTYQPPASPRKVTKKKGKGGRHKGGVKVDENATPKQKKRRRDETSEEDSDANTSHNSRSSDESPVPPQKRKRLAG